MNVDFVQLSVAEKTLVKALAQGARVTVPLDVAPIVTRDSYVYPISGLTKYNVRWLDAHGLVTEFQADGCPYQVYVITDLGYRAADALH